MRYSPFCLMLTIVLLGCGNESIERMTAEPAPPWEALQDFSGEPLMSVAYPKDMGNWNAVKSALKSPQFAEALNTFEQSPLPAAYSDKQAQKDAMVQAWRDAIAAAETGSQDELKAKVEAAMASITAAAS